MCVCVCEQSVRRHRSDACYILNMNVTERDEAQITASATGNDAKKRQQLLFYSLLTNHRVLTMTL